MFGARWRLFRLLGIPIYVDAGWLIILALVTLSLARGFPELLNLFFPGMAHTFSWYEYGLMGLVTALAFFACIVLHELGHAVVARSRGMPISGITLFLFGGVAEIGDEPPSAATEFLMAIAGPVVSVFLAVAFTLLTWFGARAGWPHVLLIILGSLAFINAFVLLFNLVPAFPLDGGRVLRSILWGASGNLRQATYWASLAGRGFAWLLIAWGVFQALMGNVMGGIWLFLIGLFLNSAARGSYQQVLLRQGLQGEPVRRFMNPEPIAVPPGLDLRTWVEDYVYQHHRKAFPVVSNGRLVGLVTTRALADIPRAEWGVHRVDEVMTRDLQAVSIPPDADALQALAKMQRTGLSRLLVTEGDRLLGIISVKDLMRFLSLKLELEGEEGPSPAGPGYPTVRDRREAPMHHREQAFHGADGRGV
jgi:Zn-dependent protease/CBS domain-containing protein